MTPVTRFLDGSVTLYRGDARTVLSELPDASIDAVVTDPPYGLAFMGKAWDRFQAGDIAMRRNPEMDAVNAGMSRQGGRQRACTDYQKRQAADMRAFQAWCETWTRECFRILKPGGHVVAFGGTRTQHRLVCAIEDAGFECRDTLAFLHGQGFPKSHNLGNGWGSALKPAMELVCLARKPLVGTLAANVAAHGTGALNIDGCRIGTEIRTIRAEVPNLRRSDRGENGATNDGRDAENWRQYKAATGIATRTYEGRWPANVVHDGSDEVLAAFAEAGERGSFTQERVSSKAHSATSYTLPGDKGERVGFGDTGSAARFFYTAKADRDDRAGSTHPTIKPLDLMRWLVRLVCPPGIDRVVLDPFAGSGTTGEAAVLEGMRAVLIEREAAYCDDIARRLDLLRSGPELRALKIAQAREERRPTPWEEGTLFAP